MAVCDLSAVSAENLNVFKSPFLSELQTAGALKGPAQLFPESSQSSFLFSKARYRNLSAVCAVKPRRIRVLKIPLKPILNF